METFQVILTSSVISAFVAAFVTIWNAQKKISIENITQERAKWREKVREKTLDVHNAIIGENDEKLQRLKVEFSIILNPSDPEDNAILQSIKVANSGEELKQSDEFSKRIALLLKHDWERAKLEAGSIFDHIKKLLFICKKLELFFKKFQLVKREPYQADANYPQD
jgi:hypothetical protein